ncbi:hypothetical protein Scep_030129 [Stephania cephalantha]|uniref:Uncharacterized protein n=1 Tax=Stephania cephalantha TaxID=152367 RepID=A0AAP0E2A9_9MAGN
MASAAAEDQDGRKRARHDGGVPKKNSGVAARAAARGQRIAADAECSSSSAAGIQNMTRKRTRRMASSRWQRRKKERKEKERKARERERRSRESDESAGAHEGEERAVGQRFRAGGGAVRSGGPAATMRVAVIAQAAAAGRAAVGCAHGTARPMAVKMRRRRHGAHDGRPPSKQQRCGGELRLADKRIDRGCGSAPAAARGSKNAQPRSRSGDGWKAARMELAAAWLLTRKREKKKERKLEREIEDPMSDESAELMRGEERHCRTAVPRRGGGAVREQRECGCGGDRARQAAAGRERSGGAALAGTAAANGGGRRRQQD